MFNILNEIKHAIGIYSASIILMLDKYKRMLKITIITLIAIVVLVFIALYMANKSFNSFIDTYILRKRISEKDVNSLTIDTDNLSLIYAYDK